MARLNSACELSLHNHCSGRSLLAGSHMLQHWAFRPCPCTPAASCPNDIPLTTITAPALNSRPVCWQSCCVEYEIWAPSGSLIASCILCSAAGLRRGAASRTLPESAPPSYVDQSNCTRTYCAVRPQRLGNGHFADRIPFLDVLCGRLSRVLCRVVSFGCRPADVSDSGCRAKLKLSILLTRRPQCSPHLHLAGPNSEGLCDETLRLGRRPAQGFNTYQPMDFDQVSGVKPLRPLPFAPLLGCLNAFVVDRACGRLLYRTTLSTC